MTQLLFQRPLCLCHSGDAMRQLLGRPQRLKELTMVGQILGHPQRCHAAVTFSGLMIVGSMKGDVGERAQHRFARSEGGHGTE